MRLYNLYCKFKVHVVGVFWVTHFDFRDSSTSFVFIYFIFISIFREWVDEKIVRVTTLQQFLNTNRVDLGHTYLDIDTEDVVNKVKRAHGSTANVHFK